MRLKSCIIAKLELFKLSEKVLFNSDDVAKLSPDSILYIILHQES